jgi:hypothetical protein
MNPCLSLNSLFQVGSLFLLFGSLSAADQVSDSPTSNLQRLLYCQWGFQGLILCQRQISPLPSSIRRLCATLVSRLETATLPEDKRKL